MLAALRASVERDARARVASGEIDRPVRGVKRSFRRAAPPPPRVRMECFAITTQTTRVLVGQPFVAAGSLRDGRYSWCHQNPGPGEGAAGSGVSVALSSSGLGR